MYYVIKVEDEYLAPSKSLDWSAEFKSWTKDINEARLGTIKEMSKLALNVVKPGSITIVKVKIIES